MIKRNLTANYLGQGWSAIMGIAFVPIYIKYLGVEAYGLIGLFAILQAWLGLLDMGMSPTLSRQMARFTGGEVTGQSIRNLLRTFEIIALLIAILIGTSIWAASSWIANTWLQANNLSVETISNAFVWMGIVTALRFLEAIYRSSISGLQKQVLLNVISSASATLRGLGAVGVLMWIKSDIGIFFLWQGTVSLFTLLMLALATYKSLPKSKHSGQFSVIDLQEVKKFTGGMLFISLLSLLLMQVDKMLLSKYLTLIEYGYYMLASTIAGALYMLINPIAQTWFPRLSELYAKRENTNLVNTYHLGAQIVSVTMGSAAVVLIVFSKEILQIWTQDINLVNKTFTLVSILALGNLLNGLMWIPCQTQLAFGWTELTTRINVIAVIIIVPLIVWLTPLYGAIGAAWIWCGLNVAYVLIGLHFMFRKILKSEKWKWYLNDVTKPLLSALIAAAIISKCLIYFDLSRMLNLFFLVIASLIIMLSAAMSAPLVRQKLGRILMVTYK